MATPIFSFSLALSFFFFFFFFLWTSLCPFVPSAMTLSGMVESNQIPARGTTKLPLKLMILRGLAQNQELSLGRLGATTDKQDRKTLLPAGIGIPSTIISSLIPKVAVYVR